MISIIYTPGFQIIFLITCVGISFPTVICNVTCIAWQCCVYTMQSRHICTATRYVHIVLNSSHMTKRQWQFNILWNISHTQIFLLPWIIVHLLWNMFNTFLSCEIYFTTFIQTTWIMKMNQHINFTAHVAYILLPPPSFSSHPYIALPCLFLFCLSHWA